MLLTFIQAKCHLIYVVVLNVIRGVVTGSCQEVELDEHTRKLLNLATKELKFELHANIRITHADNYSMKCSRYDV